MVGMHPIRMYSKTQNLVTLSSAESEFYGTVKAATEAIGVLSLLRDIGQEFKVAMQVDASAALGVIQRRGVGKIRHLETGALWIQEKRLRDIISFNKTPGVLNTADLFTKNVSRQVCEGHIERLGCSFDEGRAEAAAQLHAINTKVLNEKGKHDLAFVTNKPIAESRDHKFDWSGLNHVNVECMINFVEAKKDSDFEDAKADWNEKFIRESSGACREFSCTKCSIGGSPEEWKDHWSHDHRSEPTNRIWTRHHTQSRNTLFTPSKIAHGPKDMDKLLGIRVTIGKFKDGEQFFHIDDWKDDEVAHQKLRQEWTGTTVFHPAIGQ